MEGGHQLLRGASPLGLPCRVSREPLRRLAPFAWLASLRSLASFFGSSCLAIALVDCRCERIESRCDVDELLDSHVDDGGLDRADAEGLRWIHLDTKIVSAGTKTVKVDKGVDRSGAEIGQRVPHS